MSLTPGRAEADGSALATTGTGLVEGAAGFTAPASNGTVCSKGTSAVARGGCGLPK